MPRYTEGQQAEVADKILDAAETLVVAHGWDACTSRRIGEALGQSRGLVHDFFKGAALKEALAERAYAHLLGYVLAGSQKVQSLGQMQAYVAKELAQDPSVSALMV